MDTSSERQLDIFKAGLLEGTALIYPSALVVRTRSDTVKAALQRTYKGGTIEPTRWVLRSVPKRRAIYTAWAEHSLWRRAEIEAALDSLGSA